MSTTTPTTSIPVEEPRNGRLARLENAAQKTARLLLRRKDIDVCVGSSPRYAWKERRLYLPAYSGRSEDPRLEAAWRGLVDHECSHVENSDFASLERALDATKDAEGEDTAARIMTLINVFEDIWIEREWGNQYPGAVEHFRQKNDYVVEHNGGSEVCDPEYVVPETGKPIGMWGAFCQAVLRVARGNVDLEEVAPDVQLLMADCREEIEAGWNAQSTVDAIEAARGLWKKLKSIAESEPEEEEEDEGGGGGDGPPLPPGDGPPLPPGDGPRVPGEGGDDGPTHNPGAGSAPHGPHERAAEAMGGDWGEVKSDHDVIASKYVNEMPPMYTVHPDAAKRDRVVTFGAREREQGRKSLVQLEKAAGPAAQKLMGLMRGAIAASRQSRVIGGMEDGDELDIDALPGIACGIGGDAIFSTTIQEIKESTYVAVVVDCSGSMGSSAPRDNGKGGYSVTTKAGYAAITAMAAHKSLQLLRIPHCVVGYSTEDNYHSSVGGMRPDGKYLEWSRSSRAMENLIFVPSPGLTDDGAALPFITGRGCNLDGESVMWAARYAAKHGGAYDRLIMLVVADGLPAGADDSTIEGPHLKQSVEQVCQAGIEVYGIGVCIRDMRVFRSYYPDHRGGRGRAPSGCIEIKSGAGLTDNVLRQLTQLMTRGYGTTRRGRR